MDYQEADKQLSGRCYCSRKLCNNTYLKRDGDDIHVLLHSTNVITFHKNGDISLFTGGWNTITTKGRINNYQDRAQFYTKRNEAFLCVGSSQRYWQEGSDARTFRFDGRVRIRADGQVVGIDEEERAKQMEQIHEEWREIDRENARVSRWLHMARGIKRDSSGCRCKLGGRLRRPGYNSTPNGYKRDYTVGCDCHPSGAYRRSRSNITLGECEHCGCRGVPYPRPKGLTVEKIMEESNISVRMAMAHVYGLDRFLIDAKAETLDTYGEYSLLSMPMRDSRNTWRQERITALKMTCPSTAAVYVSPISPDCRTIAEALDWYFDTTDYLGTLKAEA
jgi:hypothetical protein